MGDRELFRLNNTETICMHLFRLLSEDAQKAMLLQMGMHADKMTGDADNVIQFAKIKAG